MIRTCVRTIIMTVLKIKYESIQDHFIQLPTVEYFIFIVLYLRDLIFKLDDELNNSSSPNNKVLSNLIGDILDEILFLSDLFELHLRKISYVLMNTIFSNLIMPLLCESLVTKSKPKISISLSIFILILFIDNIKNETFSNVLFTILLSDKRSPDLVEYLKTPKENKNYINEWRNNDSNSNANTPSSQKASGNNDSFFDFIANNYSEGFLMSLLYDKNIINTAFPNCNELKEINKKIKARNKDSPTDITFEEIQKIVHDSFSPSEMKTMKEYHKSVGKNIGLAIGVFFIKENNGGNNKFEASFMYEMLKYYKIAKLKYVDKSHLLFTNEIKTNLFSYLVSKDDTLLLLVNMMLFFSIEKNIAPFLVSEAKLINYNKANKGNHNTPNSNNDLLYLNSLFVNNNGKNSNNSINDSFILSKSFVFDNQFFANMFDDTIKPDLVLIKNLIKVSK